MSEDYEERLQASASRIVDWQIRTGWLGETNERALPVTKPQVPDVYPHPQEMRTCPLCGAEHDASFKFGGVPILACPEVSPDKPLMFVPSAPQGKHIRVEGSSVVMSDEGARQFFEHYWGCGLSEEMNMGVESDGKFTTRMFDERGNPTNDEAAAVAFLHEPKDLSMWTCERGCGYEGNAAESNACEVCGRGKGD